MSPRDLQALYIKQPKKAIDNIQFIPSIDCKVRSVDLRHGLLLQLEIQNPPSLKEQLWRPCLEGIEEELTMPFQVEEIQKALSHPNSAPGPDGWKYEDLARQTDFSKHFVEGLHQIAATSKTPNSWRAYNSMMLFKKPDEFVPGQESVLKNFRPIGHHVQTININTMQAIKQMVREEQGNLLLPTSSVFTSRGPRKYLICC